MPKLSQISYKNLQGVNPQLVELVEIAIIDTPIDFRVTDGLRSLSEQKHLVAIGASKTLDSKHLTGDAIDIVPWINGKPKWEWPLIYTLAEHIRSVAQELNVRLIWGALWGVAFTNTIKKPQDLVEAYVQRRRKVGRRVFLDGPHYELVSRTEKS